MNEEELLEDEQIKRILTPHPLSFIKFQSIFLFTLLWGLLLSWLITFSEHWAAIKSFFIGFFGGFSYIPAVVVWWAVVLLGGVVFSLVFIRWKIFILYLGFLGVGTFLMFWSGWQDTYALFIPLYSTAFSAIGFIVIDGYRRFHKYVITNLRVIFKGGVFTKRERSLRYDKITDIDGAQGILGQIFGFGTIIPITQSGFGLGADTSFAAMGGETKASKKLGLFGFAGGGKEVQTPRARSYYELHGIYPYKKIRKLVESLVQGNVLTKYQEDQVAYQKEQVDIQKQMKDLLKKQQDLKDDKED